MNDQELVKWARACASEGDFCVSVLVEELAGRVEALAGRCARYAEEIAVMQERERWISVEEALPEGGDWVLCFCIDGSERVLRYDCVTDDWDFAVIFGHGYAFPRDVVTHWRPLPEVPKEAE